MSEPFVAEIRIFAGNFAPRGWAFCNGQLLPISQNTALFSLIGTTYGGDGRTTTALPNLEGRAPMHPGRGPGLTDRRCEMTGPASRKLTVNALNSGARVWMADLEDATAPTWFNVIDGQVNLYDAIRGQVDFTDDNGKELLLTATQMQVAIRLYEKEVEAKKKESRSVRKDMTTLCGQVLGQCTPSTRRSLEGHDDRGYGWLR